MAKKRQRRMKRKAAKAEGAIGRKAPRVGRKARRAGRKIGRRAAPATAADVATRVRTMIARHAARLTAMVTANKRGFSQADILAALGADGAAVTDYLAKATGLAATPATVVTPAPAAK